LLDELTEEDLLASIEQAAADPMPVVEGLDEGDGVIVSLTRPEAG